MEIQTAYNLARAARQQPPFLVYSSEGPMLRSATTYSVKTKPLGYLDKPLTEQVGDDANHVVVTPHETCTPLEWGWVEGWVDRFEARFAC